MIFHEVCNRRVDNPLLFNPLSSLLEASPYELAFLFVIFSLQPEGLPSEKFLIVINLILGGKDLEDVGVNIHESLCVVDFLRRLLHFQVVLGPDFGN